MYDVILNPPVTDVNPNNGFKVNPAVIFLTDKKVFYGRVHLDITIGEHEYIPDPEDGDISRIPNASGGEDITIKLNVYGSEGGLKFRKGTIRAKILDGELPDQDTIPSIHTLMGNRQFGISAKVFRNNVEVGSGGGTISNQSDIEIY